jgi:hypothetical protein
LRPQQDETLKDASAANALAPALLAPLGRITDILNDKQFRPRPRCASSAISAQQFADSLRTGIPQR